MTGNKLIRSNKLEFILQEVSVQWLMVGRPAWWHILAKKSIDSFTEPLWLGSLQQLKIFREFQIIFRTVTGSIKYNLDLIPFVQSIWCIIYKFYYSCSFTPIIWMHDWMTFWYSHESFNVLFWLLFWNSYSRRIKIRINSFSSCSLSSFNC